MGCIGRSRPGGSSVKAGVSWVSRLPGRKLSSSGASGGMSSGLGGGLSGTPVGGCFTAGGGPPGGASFGGA